MEKEEQDAENFLSLNILWTFFISGVDSNLLQIGNKILAGSLRHNSFQSNSAAKDLIRGGFLHHQQTIPKASPTCKTIATKQNSTCEVKVGQVLVEPDLFPGINGTIK